MVVVERVVVVGGGGGGGKGVGLRLVVCEEEMQKSIWLWPSAKH